MLHNREVTVHTIAVEPIVIQPLTQISNMRFVPLRLGQLVQQISHMLIKIFLELLHHVGVVILQDCPFNNFSLLLASLLPSNARVNIIIHLVLVDIKQIFGLFH